MSGNLLINYGTRPEYIKILPLVKELSKLGIKHTVLYTGQHEHIVPTDIAKTRLTKVSSDNDHKTNRLDSIIKNILETPFIYHNVTHVLVQGDTTSAFATALGAFHREIPIIHLEAGLRTYQYNPYPEEFNRASISRMASLHFAPTELNKKNLLREGVPEKHIYVTGNTGLDNLIHIEPSYGNTVIITLHRRENFPILPEYFKELNAVARAYEAIDFLFPMHPNPNVQKYRYLLTAQNIKIVNSIPYDDFMLKLARAKFFISDSGGLQEEASFFKKRIIICRESTERPEILGTFGLLCKQPKDLLIHFKNINNNYKINLPSPYGDGTASKQIALIIKEYVS